MELIKQIGIGLGRLSLRGRAAGHKRYRWLVYGLLISLSYGLCLLIQPSGAMRPPLGQPSDSLANDTSSSVVVQTLLQQGQQQYEAQQYEAAIALLQQAIATAEQSGNRPTQVMGLRNLALIHQQLRQFDAARDAIATAFPLLETIEPPRQATLRASLLDVQGGVEFSQGLSEAALANWKQAETIYQELGATDDAIQARVNQAQALQNLGFYRQSIALLIPIVGELDEQPDSTYRAIALRSLGDGLRFVGEFERSQVALQASVEMAQRLQQQDLAQSAQLSLANTLNAQGDRDRALAIYQVLSQSAPDDLRAPALSNQIRLLLDSRQTTEAKALWPTVQAQLETLAPSQAAIFARVNVVQSFIKLDSVRNPSQRELADQLAIAIRQARSLGNTRSESYAMGTLASLYEQSNQWENAQSLTESALSLAQTNNANNIAYLWQWQLGRIYKAWGEASGDRLVQQRYYAKATSAYKDAVDTLQLLRTDLVAVNPQVQVSFQESVEPIHRELVSLLLDPTYQAVTPAKIEQARQVIESLQLAELDNFFREACLDKQPVSIDALDPHAAIIYPIMLRDRLEVVISLPNQDVRHYSSPIPQTRVEALVEQLRQDLTLRISHRFRPGMTNLYDWMIRPILADLQSSQVETLVFVLDGALRNLPMAALYDGESYLVEHYSIAVTPGLQLVNSRPLQEQELRVLTGALSEARQGFSALPNVLPEIEQIQATVPSQVLLNEAFTQESFQIALRNEVEPIVHLATHGKFSSNKDQTFLLTWDGQMDINALNNVLQISTLNQDNPIELLVLSACQTATGDKEAALGLAGMAVRAGTRSTIATLWQVNDEATALLMEKLYAELSSRQLSKAEALRRAQLKILQEPKFREHPYFWAAFILVGNWL